MDFVFDGPCAIVDIIATDDGAVVGCRGCPWSLAIPGWMALDVVACHASEPHPAR